MTVRRLLLILIPLLLICVSATPAFVLGTTERVSVNTAGAEGNQDSHWPSIAADGRSVAFESWATNLVPGDTNEKQDIFVRDRYSGTTERVSVSSGGQEADGSCYHSSLSADGRYVAFFSCATNLVPNDTNGHPDIFVRDRHLGITERVSVSTSGDEAANCSYYPRISSDGSCVVFISRAANLVADDTNGAYDIFVRDRETGTTERVSISTSGVQANDDCGRPSINADGRYVAFLSYASAQLMFI